VIDCDIYNVATLIIKERKKRKEKKKKRKDR